MFYQNENISILYYFGQYILIVFIFFLFRKLKFNLDTTKNSFRLSVQN